jgi:hypothetical protein
MRDARYARAKGTRMRIRWTTRIAMAVGVITLIAGIAAGGPASAAQAGSHVLRSHAAAASHG